MRFILNTVNTELADNHRDLEFSSMDSLLAYVKEEGFEWTSLVISVLPE
jgi:hypothetical protein